MKKSILFTMVFLLLFSLANYGEKLPPEVKPLMEKMAVTFEKFINGLEKAENADHIVVAFDGFTKTFQKLTPKMKALNEKYPELKNMKDDGTEPEELKPVMKKLEELGKRMFGVLMKVQKYADHPKVKEAQNRWQKAMAAMEAVEGDSGEEEEEEIEE